MLNRSFGIRQGSGESAKIRLIDNFTASGVNLTVQVDAVPKLHTLDVVAGLCFEVLKSPGNDKWLGKTVDLSAAYRQLGINPKSYWVSYIGVFDPSCGCAKVYSLPFL